MTQVQPAGIQSTSAVQMSFGGAILYSSDLKLEHALKASLNFNLFRRLDLHRYVTNETANCQFHNDRVNAWVLMSFP
jgi:hypothetical protein